MEIVRVAGYVKLAKLWERNADQAIDYHNKYYSEKFSNKSKYELVGVYIDITGKKEIYNRPEMLRLLRDCMKGKVDCIVSQTKGYLAANTKEFCYLIHFLFTLGSNIEIVTEDYSYNINTAINFDEQKAALSKMAEEYIALNPQDYLEWSSSIQNAIYNLFGEEQ